jgi:hypothetical protein
MSPGHNGMVGSAIMSRLADEGCQVLVPLAPNVVGVVPLISVPLPPLHARCSPWKMPRGGAIVVKPIFYSSIY